MQIQRTNGAGRLDSYYHYLGFTVPVLTDESENVLVWSNGQGFISVEDGTIYTLAEPYDYLSEMMDWESGESSPERELRLFSYLTETGMINHLQGMYGRQAHRMGLI